MKTKQEKQERYIKFLFLLIAPFAFYAGNKVHFDSNDAAGAVPPRVLQQLMTGTADLPAPAGSWDQKDVKHQDNPSLSVHETPLDDFKKDIFEEYDSSAFSEKSAGKKKPAAMKVLGKKSNKQRGRRLADQTPIDHQNNYRLKGVEAISYYLQDGDKVALNPKLPKRTAKLGIGEVGEGANVIWNQPEGGGAGAQPAANPNAIVQKRKTSLNAIRPSKGSVAAAVVGACISLGSADFSDPWMYVSIVGSVAMAFGPVGLAIGGLLSVTAMIATLVRGSPEEDEAPDIWGMIEQQAMAIADQAVISNNLRETTGSLRALQGHAEAYYSFKEQRQEGLAQEALFMMIQSCSSIFHSDLQMDSYDLDFVGQGCKMHCQQYDQILMFMGLHLTTLEAAIVEIPDKSNYYSKQLLEYADKYEAFIKEYHQKLVNTGRNGRKDVFVKFRKPDVEECDDNVVDLFSFRRCKFQVYDISRRIGELAQGGWLPYNGHNNQFWLHGDDNVNYYGRLIRNDNCPSDGSMCIGNDNSYFVKAKIDEVFQLYVWDHEARVSSILNTKAENYRTDIVDRVFGGLDGVFNASKDTGYGFCRTDNDCPMESRLDSGKVTVSQGTSPNFANDGLAYTKTAVVPDETNTGWFNISWFEPLEISRISIEFGELTGYLAPEDLHLTFCNDNACQTVPYTYDGMADDALLSYTILDVPLNGTRLTSFQMNFTDQDEHIELTEVRVFFRHTNPRCVVKADGGVGFCEPFNSNTPGLRHHYDFYMHKRSDPLLVKDLIGGKDGSIIKPDSQETFATLGPNEYLNVGPGAVRLPDNLLTQSGWGKDVTIELLLKQFVPPSADSIWIRAFDIGSTNSGGHGENYWALVLDWGGQTRLNAAARTSVTNSSDDMNRGHVVSPDFEVGRLTHLVATYEEVYGRFNFFMDGRLVSTSNITANSGFLASLDPEFFLGKSHFNQDGLFHGEFHDLKIYNKALDETEVAQSRHAYLPKVRKGVPTILVPKTDQYGHIPVMALGLTPSSGTPLLTAYAGRSEWHIYDCLKPGSCSYGEECVSIVSKQKNGFYLGQFDNTRLNLGTGSNDNFKESATWCMDYYDEFVTFQNAKSKNYIDCKDDGSFCEPIDTKTKFDLHYEYNENVIV